MQSVKIIAHTTESVDGSGLVDKLRLFSGKLAGICYMKDDYLSEGIQNEKSAMARANMTDKSGHHSVADHPHLTYEIHTNKLGAMLLNSLGDYTTSEKSARYTVMKPRTEDESRLYRKWTEKLRTIILAEYPDYDDVVIKQKLKKKLGEEVEFTIKDGKLSVDCDVLSEVGTKLTTEFSRITNEDKELPSYKMAIENARYMISVFTPTIMGYTMSLRQTALAVQYLNKLADKCENTESDFYSELGKTARGLAKAFTEQIDLTGMYIDNKCNEIEFIEDPTGTKGDNKKEYLGDSYVLRYKCSFACLAQEHRHRTLDYSFFIGADSSEYEFYVPEIVKAYNLEEEWLTDIKSIASCIPQGTLIDVTEQGKFEDFARKCKERLCGRAQREIMSITVESTEKFKSGELCERNRAKLEDMLDNDNVNVVPRCGFSCFKCTEGCRWGKRDALTRKI